MVQGDDTGPASDERVKSAPEGGQSDRGEENKAAREGLSAFVARILDQLSVTAWLPSALLTASLTVLFEFRARGSVDLGAAVVALTDQPVRILVLAIPVLVISTMITQAFSFQAIRILEGYWQRPLLSSLTRRLLTKAQLRRKNRLKRKVGAGESKIFDMAMKDIEAAGVSRRVRWAIEAEHRRERPVELDEREQQQLRHTNWHNYCPPWKVAEIDRLREQYENFPEDRRLLPSRLGNCMRATEDRLRNTQGDVESFVMRCRDLVPLRLQIHHDQFRNRLDMYCTLVFVTSALAAATLLLLLGSAIAWWKVALLSAGFLLLGFISYQAAISSAAGYCTVLRRMDEIVESAKNRQPG